MIDIGYALSKLYNPPPDYTAVDSAGPATLANIAIWRDARPIPTQLQLDTAVLECEAEQAVVAQRDAQRADGETDLAAAWTDTLHSLPVRDAVIILWARRLAQIRADAVTINTRAQAAAYWDGEMTAAGNEAGRLQVQRDSFQAMLELIAVALVR